MNRPERVRTRGVGASVVTADAPTAATVDVKPYDARPRIGRAEREFQNQLIQVAKHSGALIKKHWRNTNFQSALRAYAVALRPWARTAVNRMLGEVDAQDRNSWRSLGNAISSQLRFQLMHTDIGAVVHKLLAEQVELIESIPIEAGQRVQHLILEGTLNSQRAFSYVDEIERSGEVAYSRAVLIAQTETSRVAATLRQARAQAIGSPGYVWETAEDQDVRSSHAAMQGSFVRWDNPPTLDGLTGHAGCLPRCRCYSRPVLPE